MNHTPLYSSTGMTKSPRAWEIDLLVYFIRMADLQNARQSLVTFLERGERVSREIVADYERLESRRLAA